MRIAELTAFHVRIPLTHAIRHASHVRSDNDSLIVRCRLDDGMEGWGEGLPRPYVTGETIETAFEQLRATDLQFQLGEEFDGLRFVYYTAESFAQVVGPEFEIVETGRYTEMDENDSIYFVQSKRE